MRRRVTALVATASVLTSAWLFTLGAGADDARRDPFGSVRPAPVVVPVPTASDPLGDALHSLPTSEVVRLCSWGSTLSPAEEVLAQAC